MNYYDTSANKSGLLIENAFYFWLNSTILFLSMLPIIGYVLHKADNKVWTFPITWESKGYVLCVLSGLFIVWLFKHLANTATVFRYRFFAIFFYPFAVLAYSYITNDFAKYLVVFLFSSLGCLIQFYDLYRPIIINSGELIKKSHNILLISIGITVGLVVYKSTGSEFSIISIWMLLAFLAFFIILRYVNISAKYILWLLPVFIFIVTFLSMDNDYIDYVHYGFFLGPVVEIVYGHLHPFMLDIQYGAGLTWFLALYFKLLGGVSFVGLQILLRILTYIQYILVYFIAFRMYSSHKIAFLALLAVLAFSFYYMYDLYYYPSTGFLRFGFVYLILGCYLLEGVFISRYISLLLICTIASVAAIWSPESAFFTLPALFFTEYVNRNLLKVLTIFGLCFIVVLVIYFFPFIAAGKWPMLSKYYEYETLYSSGLVKIALSRETSFWWLFPLVYLFVLMNVIIGKIK
ncbi:MAG TPA: hypothetical protein VKR58_02875, partial [Aquella sp.]|nr:hypothetical protein [Aquella sp.]